VFGVFEQTAALCRSGTDIVSSFRTGGGVRPLCSWMVAIEKLLKGRALEWEYSEAVTRASDRPGRHPYANSSIITIRVCQR
jgi:hypothetical protein